VHVFPRALFDYSIIESTTLIWCLNAYLALHDLNLTLWWTVGLLERLKSSPTSFKREITKLVCLFIQNMQEWRTTLSKSLAVASDVIFCARAHWHSDCRIKPLYGCAPYFGFDSRPSQELELWQFCKPFLFKFLLL
jgi:hypothetical protein